MYNYLFFPTAFKNWKMNINDLEHKTTEIQSFYSLFHPRYNLRYKDMLDTENKEIKYYTLKPHEYYYITQEDYKIVFKDPDNLDDPNKSISITPPIGSILVSNALNEGQMQYNNTNSINYYLSIQNQPQYYFIQPLGGACYYLWQNQYNRLHSFYSFVKPQYGLKLPLKFNWVNTRWVYENTNNVFSGVSISEDDIKGGTVNNRVWGEQFTLISSLDTKPIVSIQYENEEVIMDASYYMDSDEKMLHVKQNIDQNDWPNWTLKYICY